MNHPIKGFDELHSIEHLRHYLPTQAALKDFIHHNTLHAFQQESFHDALKTASEAFGYQVYLSLEQYRQLYKEGKINPEKLTDLLQKNTPEKDRQDWHQKMLSHTYDQTKYQKIGQLRKRWKSAYKVNMDKTVHPVLFRLLGVYLDQGIGITPFPRLEDGFIASLRTLEKTSYSSLFKSSRVRALLLDESTTITLLLKLLIGEEPFFETYLFDQQFNHPGWSGIVSVIEQNPSNLLDPRKISLKEFILLELLLEIDTLDQKFGFTWKPLAQSEKITLTPLFIKSAPDELDKVLRLWQEAYEWTYFDQVIKGLQLEYTPKKESETAGFQAVFCIDDRECSFRRHLENSEPKCTTFSTAGYFNVAMHFQPQEGKFYTKMAPASLAPEHLIKEKKGKIQHNKNALFHKITHSLLGGIIASQTLGLWAGLKLARSIFYPTANDALISAFKHMDKNSELAIFSDPKPEYEAGLKLGFSKEEMVDRVEAFLKSLGLIENFSNIIYVVGHGASSVNNTHYAGYDCGACSGRAGSVNARAICIMANHPEVRYGLSQRQINIPDTTIFIGAIHDTTRDEMEYFDTDNLSKEHQQQHQHHIKTFEQACTLNAKERARRFLLMSPRGDAKKVHKKVKRRSLSLFETRPEWNHANNALCIVGRRASNKHLFFDKRAFLNSYDYRLDPDGKMLLNILSAVAPVCGGINLEYYFSRVDNYRLGAGTKLSHNVMGLFGVANGMEGDLLTGLPRQMVDIHEPLRLMVVVEQFPDVVLTVIKAKQEIYNWFDKAWIHLAVIQPETKLVYVLERGEFIPYQPITTDIEKIGDLNVVFEKERDSLPVFTLS